MMGSYSSVEELPRRRPGSNTGQRGANYSDRGAAGGEWGSQVCGKLRVVNGPLDSAQETKWEVEEDIQPRSTWKYGETDRADRRDIRAQKKNRYRMDYRF